MRKVVILQARLGSSRYPEKVIAEISGKPVIAHIIDRLKESATSDEICAAIPGTPAEDKLADVLSKYPVTLCRGSENDVLSRFIQAAYQTSAEIIIRAKANNPFVDPKMIDQLVNLISEDPDLEYCTFKGVPGGVSAEVFRLKTLEKLDYLVKHPGLRKHVTRYLIENPGPFSAKFIEADSSIARSEFKLSMNSVEDYRLVSDIYARLYREGDIIQLRDVLTLLDEDKTLFERASAHAAVASGG